MSTKKYLSGNEKIKKAKKKKLKSLFYLKQELWTGLALRE